MSAFDFCYVGEETNVDLGGLAPASSAHAISPKDRVVELERDLNALEASTSRAMETLQDELMEARAVIVDLELEREQMLDHLGLTEVEWMYRRMHASMQYCSAIAVLTQPRPEVPPPIPVSLSEIPPPIPGDEAPPPIPSVVLEMPPPIPVVAQVCDQALVVVDQSVAWNEDQVEALDAVDYWLESTGDWDSVDDLDVNFLSLTGPAGTGKTTLAREIVRRHPGASLCATTGRAALRLSDVVGEDATTLHRILYYPPEAGADLRFERLRDPPSRFVVVDESPMLSPSVYQHLRVWASQGVRILFVGDSYQLPPVVTGEEARRYGEDFTVFSLVGGPELRAVVRNVGGVLRAANRVRETGEIVRSSDLDGPGRGYEFGCDRHPASRAVEEYLSSPGDTLLITWKNSARMAANDAIRQKLGHDGPLPDEGEPVLIRKNGQGVMNGQIVVAKSFESGPMVGSMRTMWLSTTDGDKFLVNTEGGPRDKGGCWMDGGLPWVDDYKKFHSDLRYKLLPEPLPVTWGYCLTCHAGQGSQAKRVIVFLERGDENNRAFRKMTTLPGGAQAPFSSRWSYTAQTRAVEYALFLVGR